ncbi:hypothetical protein DNTS_032724 [Danionella cerebrum]|uniref:Glutaredoxin domain-containing protein n=1 Tax=Danionella cerebrum TaxID=2873325 RepID=A0A553NVZ7_9TELE|nr:hypothetical protein DNTS_032724 [Danionella translucida]
MERRASRPEETRSVRFRVASARSGRVLKEVFRERTDDSGDTDTTASSCSEPERACSPGAAEANGHLSGLGRAETDDSGSEPDELLLYASATEKLFTGKRVNIFSKNGTIRGVRDKVSAGQVLFNNLSKMYGVSFQNVQKTHLKQTGPKDHELHHLVMDWS